MDSKEARAYAEAVGTGEFHETLEKVCRRSYMDRSTLKEQVFKQVLYGRHNYNRKPLLDRGGKIAETRVGRNTWGRKGVGPKAASRPPRQKNSYQSV